MAVLILQVIIIAATSAIALPKTNGTQACQAISNTISDASQVIYGLNPDFTSDIHHWFLSSSQIPSCVLEVGSAEDTASALKIISDSRTPFAIQSGGHASNPGFSSTRGVHISLRRLQQVSLSPDKSKVTIGMGMTWADVYERLDGSGVNVVGGRTPGPGVGGFTLGGGFSWKTNQYGLTCDTVKSFNLVLPNGTISTIDSTQADLFFALKGGFNRFGIVTSAEYCTHPQVDHGGVNYYAADETEAILNATTRFYTENKDPKAQIITTLSGSLIGTTALVIFFYDGPKAPASFSQFEDIIPLTLIPNLRSQSFSSFVSGIPSKLVVNPRGTFNTFSTSRLTMGFVKAVKSEADKYGSIVALHGGLMASYDIEPFLASYGNKATNSAYPHVDSPLPLNVYFAWTSPDEDEFWYDAIHSSVQHLMNVAIQEDIYVETKYPNYAIGETPAIELYGSQNLQRLRDIRRQVDPANVMELAGGFTI